MELQDFWGLSLRSLRGRPSPGDRERMAAWVNWRFRKTAAPRRSVGWGTDPVAFAQAVADFEAALPGFWWSVGQCSVGAHASCAVDGKGSQAHLLEGLLAGEPLDEGFHCDTTKGTPSEALRDVMRQAVEHLNARPHTGDKKQ
jgi:hypothetical protein